MNNIERLPTKPAEKSADFENQLRQIKSIADANNLSSWSIPDYSAEIATENCVCLVCLNVAVSNKPIKGFIIGRLFPEADEAEILNIAVERKLQNQGIGQNLLEKFTELCRTKTIKTIWLEVREKNRQARSFYEKHNFSLVYVRKNYYVNPPDSAVVMRMSFD